MTQEVHVSKPLTKPLMELLVEHHQDMARIYQNRLRAMSCGNCDHWGAGRCGKWNVTPPSDVQKIGCEDYVYDQIPF